MADGNWIDAAIEHLARLDGRKYATRQRNTIIAIAAARAQNRGEATALEQPGTCGRSTYHKWRRDPVFSEVLEAVTRIARNFASEQALRSRQAAVDLLAAAAPRAVEVIVQELGNSNPFIRLRAAFGILDRVGLDALGRGADSSDLQINIVDYRHGLATLAPGSDGDSD